jgi:hypothetical protein
MAIGVSEFQILSPEQANPLGYGFRQGVASAKDIAEAYRQALLGDEQRIKNEFARPRAEQELLKDQLANALSKIQLKYADPLTQAKLDNERLQPGLTQSQIDLYKQQAKFYPLAKLIEAQEASNKYNRFGQAYQLSRALQDMSKPAKDLWISQHQDEYNTMISDIANGINQHKDFLSPEVLKTFFPDINFQSESNLSQNQKFQPDKKENIDQIRLANEMAANKQLTTAATARQMEGALQVEGILNDPELEKRVRNSAHYAGLLGKEKYYYDSLFDRDNPRLQDYRTLMHIDMPLLLNRIKTLDQMGATNKQREELYSLYNKTMNSWFASGDQFKNQFQRLKKSLDNVAKSVQKSASPIANVNRLESTKNNLSYSNEDIEFTAKKYGLTPEQVRQKLAGG